MSREDAFEVEGKVVEALSERVFRVELPNGHRLLAHPGGRKGLEAGRISLGDQIRVKISPFDLSKGRIRN